MFYSSIHLQSAKMPKKFKTLCYYIALLGTGRGKWRSYLADIVHHDLVTLAC